VDVASCASGPRFAGRGARHETAYVIFTSGSTGTPKGVVVARSGLDHYVNWIGTSLQVGSSDRVSQYANVAFDLSVLEIYGALCFGASLHPAGGLGDRMMPARMVEREQLTIWISVPSVVGLMMQANEVTQENLGSIRRFVFCGEPLLGTQVEALFSACPDATVQNTYGPTEATVSMTSVVMTADSFAGECGSSVALGDPIKGMNLLLLGGPSADEGEIVIVGPQVALGYWQDPVKTDKAFRTVVQDGKVCRAYFTGDWAERREGRIFFKQRIDFQVKIKGFRIELDEIAAAIVASGFPNVCVFKHNERLVAVIEASASSPFNDRALHQVLARRLESYAIPQDLRVIRRLPRNDNDKIDRELTRNWYASLTQATPAAPVLEAGVVAVEADRSASLNLLINLASPGQGNS
jgi:D-alanine--poly(phosphoribitol) ligase subunit 1